MPPLAIAAGISGISSIAGAALSRKGSTTTSTNNNMPLFTPAQNEVQKQLGLLIQQMMSKGEDGRLARGMKNRGRTAINTNFDNIGKRIEANATMRGFGPGASGKFVTNQKGMDIERAKQMTDYDTGIEEQEWMRKMGVMNLAMGFSHPYGNSSTSSTTQPGPGIGSTIANVGGDIGSLLALSKFLK